jgi:hypothetical protein
MEHWLDALPDVSRRQAAHLSCREVRSFKRCFLLWNVRSNTGLLRDGGAMCSASVRWRGSLVKHGLGTSPSRPDPLTWGCGGRAVVSNPGTATTPHQFTRDGTLCELCSSLPCFSMISRAGGILWRETPPVLHPATLNKTLPSSLSLTGASAVKSSPPGPQISWLSPVKSFESFHLAHDACYALT